MAEFCPWCTNNSGHLIMPGARDTAKMSKRCNPRTDSHSNCLKTPVCKNTFFSDSLSDGAERRLQKNCLLKKRATGKCLRIQKQKETLKTKGILKKGKRNGKNRRQRRTESIVQSSGTGTREDSLCHAPQPPGPFAGVQSVRAPASLNSLTAKEGSAPLLDEQWDGDSGFSSEVSPAASSCSSPCPGVNPSKLVAMDCEMVGTGPQGRCSELARCSLVNYYGDVLYDKYIRPQQPVTDYRTRWSGIRQHHMLHAVPFKEAKKEILQILKGKVVVGHALHHDFRVLDFYPQRCMVRDTSRTHLLRQRSDFHVKGSISLKNLANKLLKRNIQVGRMGHSSVEDALAAMDLYKLVEGQWEQEILTKGQDLDLGTPQDSVSSTSHYMQDQYWPEELTDHCE